MGALLRLLVPERILRPLARLVVGLIAIPIFRLFLRKVVRLQELDEEMEKDFEQWFRGSLLLLVATRNMEAALFHTWFPSDIEVKNAWIVWALRLMLAISVIEIMPDQQLFSIIHPGPPKLRFSRKRPLHHLRMQAWPICRGVLCQHLSRSSPVFAILCAIVPGTVGWVCYFIAIAQYLLIGLVTSRDKALNVLSAFDRQVAVQRREIIKEFHLENQPVPSKKKPAPASTGEGDEAARSTDKPSDRSASGSTIKTRIVANE